MTILHQSKTAAIRAHLERGESITPGEALLVYQCARLASVIADLRDSGLEIDTIPRRDLVGNPYGAYRLRRKATLGSRVRIKTGHAIGLPRWVRAHTGGTVTDYLPGDMIVVRFVRGQDSTLFTLRRDETIVVS